ncbi:MAG: metallophosphoesterase family protein [Desulfobacteraceae bacterium]|nr:metallophosphoesterase family protein [Desulfobacteraceae bacterium]MBC2755023.1 metallophosphoesterase family protein [Desulfobacteraceae bacterium]
MDDKLKRIGLISDTHGLLRDSAVKALADSDIIIHAGDIDTPDIIDTLKKIAPVFPVRGNMDRNPKGAVLPKYEIVEMDEIAIYVLHDLYQLDLDPATAGFDVVVSGHSHRPKIEYRDGVLYINPGSAGPRRFTLPISVGRLEIENGRITPKIIEIHE